MIKFSVSFVFARRSRTRFIAVLLFLGCGLAKAQVAPQITSQPTPQVAIVGGRAIFTVIADGTVPLTYQWQKNGTNIFSATNDVLILTNVQLTNAGQYSVIVSNAGGITPSTNAVLSVRNPQAGDVDLSFNTGLGINGTVSSVTIQSDGKILIAGSFVSVEGVLRGGVARLKPDLSIDHTFKNAVDAGFFDQVTCIAVQADGRVLIAGDFTIAGTSDRRKVARLHPDGTLDATFNFSTGPNNSVTCLALIADGRALIGGLRSGSNYIARLNVDGSLDLGFDANLGANGSIVAITVQPDNRVLIGGFFTSVNGTSRNYVARLKADGSLDTAFIDGTGPNNGVQSIVLQPGGEVLIGGYFTSFNGTSRNRIARLKSDGLLDPAFNPGAGANGNIASVALQIDGKVLVGGGFTQMDGANRNKIARLNPNGALDLSFNPGTGVSGTVSSVAYQSDGKVLLGGFFISVNGTNRNRLARLSTNGVLDSAFSPGTAGVDGIVAALATQPDGRILIGGFFNSINGTNRNNIARLQVNGALDITFNPGTGTGPDFDFDDYEEVTAMARQADGKVLIAGFFDSVNGTNRNRIARLNTNGSLDLTFDAGAGPNVSPLFTLTRQQDGKILVGGTFDEFNGVSRDVFARLNANGTLDLAYSPTFGSRSVLSSATQSDGKALIGGYFTLVNGVNRAGIARLNVDGTLDPGFNTGLNVYGGVTSFAVQPDGKILIAGRFTSVDGINRPSIARLNANGTLDLNFYPDTALNYDGSSKALVALQSDGKVLVKISLPPIGGRERCGLARLHFNGVLDTEFHSGSGFNNGVFEAISSLALPSDGKVVVAGDFSSYDGIPRSSVARLLSSPPSQPPSNVGILPGNKIVDAGQIATFNVTAQGTLPMSYQWRRNGVNLSGATNYLYTVASARTNDTGSYSLIISNTFGSVTTTNVMLAVIPTQFTNSGAIQVPVGTNKANPYPSQITVSGFAQPVVKVTATLQNLTHRYPAELDVLLVGPGGQKVILMSYAGGGTANAVTNVTLTFDDDAPSGLGITARLTNGTFRPSNNAVFSQTLPAPAPPGPYGANLSAFHGSDPNGVWSLYVADNYAPENGGSMSAGWRLNIEHPVPPSITNQPQFLTNTTCGTINFTVGVAGTPPLSYQWYFNDTTIPGATGANYTRTNATMADTGLFYAVITNFQGSVTSSLVTLTVNFGPENDNFACRTPLSGTNVFFSGGNRSATAEPGEPIPSLAAGADALHSIWYQWTAPFTGGAVITTSQDFTNPCVAVYTNMPGVIAVTNLGKVAENSSLFGQLRCAFTAVAGQEYAIVFDGAPLFGGETGTGYFDAGLTLTPPPANDLFANATVIADTYFAAAGSFLGAGREAGEPSHGASPSPQTLWWTWTAPTNTGNSTIPVRIVADAVSFPPGIGVYVGNTVNALSAVSVTSRTNNFTNVNPESSFSMTRETTFAATPGVTYRIALAGLQHSANVISPRFGNFRFRLNTRVLSLEATNMTTQSTFDGSKNFFGEVRVTNLGATNSNPLRLVISVGSGVSVQGQDSGYTSSSTIVQGTNNLGRLSKNQTQSSAVNGNIPAPFENGDFSRGIGWGAFAELQEQLPSGQWLTVDQTLIGFDAWPTLNDSPGPGGGVIRLDPGYVGLSAFNPLRMVNVLGSLLVPEGSSVNYSGKAVYADSTAFNFTNTAWTASRFNITTNGVFTAGSVTSNTAVLLDASYSSGGLLYHAVTNVVVSNLPPPTVGGLRRLNGTNLAFSVTGVPGRSNRVEAATNLTPPTVWVPLLTNAPASGVFQFTNQIQTNVPRRFFRASEL